MRYLGVLALCVAVPVYAAPQKRTSVSQNGDFVIIGNTLGHECNNNAGAVAPSGGTIGACGTQTGDSAIDVFWNGDASPPNADNAVAEANSTAQLILPAGASVTLARLYWGSVVDNPGAADAQVNFAGMNVVADSAWTHVKAGNLWYQSSADVTSLVQASGTYRVSGVATKTIINQNDEDLFAGWSLVVIYRLGSEPYRNITLFDGADFVSTGNNITVPVSGFQVPALGFEAKLAVVAYEGELVHDGDQMRFRRGNVPAGSFTAADNLVDKAGGSATNFFDGSRTYLGALVSNPGDRPRLTGAAGSMSGIDIDVVDITSQLQQNDTQATLQATTSSDSYLLGVLITSISTRAPNFAGTTKTATDVNGGALQPGDEVLYTISAVNNGNDDAVNVVLYDVIPAETTYVAGSIMLNGATKTDGSGDDQAEFAGGQVIAHLGNLAIGASASVAFRIRTDQNARGLIANQAQVVAGGALGAPPTAWPSDGNGMGQGTPATIITLPECTSSAQCPADRPICNLTTHVCIACVVDSGNCAANKDSDNDGLSDADEQQLGTDPANADSDGDGLPDGVEVGAVGMPHDTDGDGLIDAIDPDDDGDGIPTATELLGGSATAPPDTDSDGTPDYKDLDSDDDGILDVIEGVDMRRFVDDVDGDGIPNYRDTDSDADGVADFEDGTNDSDGDGVPNYLDRENNANNDADGDGISNADETKAGTNPFNTDSDGDGIPDSVEWGKDSDGDGIIDALDPDDDNDGIPTSVEVKDGRRLALEDADGDGLPNYLDTDSDGDGKSDTEEGTGDGDMDGIPDYLDAQSGETVSPFARIIGGGGCAAAQAPLLWALLTLLSVRRFRFRR